MTNALTLVAQVNTGIHQREMNYVAAIDVTGSSAMEIVYCATPSSVSSGPRTCALFALQTSPTTALVPVADPSTMLAFRWASPSRMGGLDGVAVEDIDGDGAREVLLFGQESIDVLRGPRR